MARTPRPVAGKATAWEDSAVSLMGRVVASTAAKLIQSTTSTITYAVYSRTIDDPPPGSTVVVAAGTPLTVATVIFNTLKIDDRWTADTTGYNFRYDPPVTETPTGGLTYRWEVTFTPTTGAAFVAVWEVEALALAGS